MGNNLKTIKMARERKRSRSETNHDKEQIDLRSDVAIVLVDWMDEWVGLFYFYFRIISIDEMNKKKSCIVLPTKSLNLSLLLWTSIWSLLICGIDQPPRGTKTRVNQMNLLL